MQLYWKSVMKMGKITTLALATSLSLSAAFAANAALLDFTDLDTFTAPGATATTSSASGMLGSIKWTLTPSSTPMKYNFPVGSGGGLGGTDDGFDGVAKPVGTGLTYDGDGIGITDDEISGSRETLTLSFSRAVRITGIHILDLFFSEDGQSPDNPGAGDLYEYVDVFDTVTNALLATYRADQLLLNTAENNGGNAIGGYKFGGLNYEGKSLTFQMGMLGNRDDSTRDFALAGVEVSPIPVPAAGLLLLTALGGLALARRKSA